MPLLSLTASAPELRAGLEPVRRRLRVLRRAHDAVWLLAGAAGGALVGTIAHFVWGGERGPVALAGVLLTTVGIIGALAFRHRRQPVDLLTAARWAEARNGLQERLSTALEADGAAGPVADALRADAAHHAVRLDVERTVPWRWPRSASGWLFAAVVALALANLDWITPVLVHGPTNHAITESQAALRGLAAELAAEAAMTGDDDLASLAEALRRFADAAPDPDRRNELAALLDDIERHAGGTLATGELLEAWRQADRDAREEAGPGPTPGEAAAERGGASPSPSDSGAGSEASFSRFEAWVDDEDSFDFATAAPAPLDAEVLRVALDADAAPDAPEGPTTEGPPPEGGAAEIIGAAERSQAGDSSLAGRGSQELEGDAPAADLAASEPDTVLLTGIERDEGRRIELELPPTTDVEAYDPRAFELGGWRERPEAAVASDPTPLRYRTAAGTFFLPSQETAASR